MKIHLAAAKRLFVGALYGATLCLSGMAQADSRAPVVQTTAGAVEGFYKGSAAEFLGIPYAAPPVGSLRWRPPVAPAPWQAVRLAKEVGPQCAQIFTAGGFAGPPNNNEDCLYLNVFAPKNAIAGTTRLPVYVWVHGGGLANGSGNDYDGYKLAVVGRVVVVTINYRLNLFGFLAHPALDEEGHLFGNYGLLDQQFALQWVKANIASFGGDPDNVTLGGQSAGGTSTGTHLVSPLAKGLFHKAIIESAGSYLTAVPLAQARAKGVAFAKAVGCGEGSDGATVACLRRLPAAAIEQLAGSEATGPSRFLTTVINDGQIVPSGAASAFAENRFTPMPIMNGTVRDEGGLFTGIEMYGTGQPPWRTITQDSVDGMVRAVYGANAEGILKRYPAERYATAQLRSNAIQSDAFVCKAQHATHLLAGKVPLYVYEFRDRTAPTYLPEMPGYVAQAFHTAELQYLFPGFHGTGVKRDLSAKQKRLSDRMVIAWANFMRTGNPNGKGDKPWPEYEPKRQAYLAFDASGLSTISDREFSVAHQCDEWEGVLTYN
jgi:para-nitrobenzyl esterase